MLRDKNRILVATLLDVDGDVREMAVSALDEIATSLKAQGTVLWWVVPRAYWKELLALLLLLSSWFALARRFPKHRPSGKLKQTALFHLVSTAPTILACWAVYYVTTREWAQGFLPDLPITQLPFPVAAALSVGFCTVLAAVWACYGKKQADPTPGQ